MLEIYVIGYVVVIGVLLLFLATTGKVSLGDVFDVMILAVPWPLFVLPALALMVMSIIVSLFDV